LVAALLRVAGVTAGLAESNGSLAPGGQTRRARDYNGGLGRSNPLLLPSPCKNSSDFYQFQERPLAKSGMDMSTPIYPVATPLRRVYDSRHLQADCKEPGSAPEPYAR